MLPPPIYNGLSSWRRSQRIALFTKWWMHSDSLARCVMSRLSGQRRPHLDHVSQSYASGPARACPATSLRRSPIGAIRGALRSRDARTERCRRRARRLERGRYPTYSTYLSLTSARQGTAQPLQQGASSLNVHAKCCRVCRVAALSFIQTPPAAATTTATAAHRCKRIESFDP